MHLIQSAIIPKKNEWPSNEGILKTLDLDYMGSSEFEWGNVPKALLKFVLDQEEKVFGFIQLDKAGHLARQSMLTNGNHFRIDLTVTPQRLLKDEPVTIRYLVRKSKERDLRIALEQWAFAGHRGLKETVYPATPHSMHFCIDHGSEFFMWNSKIGKRLLVDRMDRSFELLCDNGSINKFGAVYEKKPFNELMRIGIGMCQYDEIAPE